MDNWIVWPPTYPTTGLEIAVFSTRFKILTAVVPKLTGTSSRKSTRAHRPY